MISPSSQIFLDFQKRVIQISFCWISSHPGISCCDKVDQIANFAIAGEKHYYTNPSSLSHVKKSAITCLGGYEDGLKKRCRIMDRIIFLTYHRDKIQSIFDYLERRQVITTRKRLSKKSIYCLCRICQLPKHLIPDHYLLH